MPRHIYRSPKGAEVAFDLGDAPGESAGPACFVLGVRKSGSSLLNIVAAALARLNRVSVVNVGDTLFLANVPTGDWIADPTLAALLHPGRAYTGFRDWPVGLAGASAFREGRKVLMVRDPRDALVSEYFSNAFSHTIPAGDQDKGAAAGMLAQRAEALATQIESYVLARAPLLVRTMLPCVAAARREPGLRLFRYEDIIDDKTALIAGVAAQFGWQCPAPALARLLPQVDLHPAVEDPKAFVRKVTPGDHREKLSAATIARLNGVLAPVMEPFGYQ